MEERETPKARERKSERGGHARTNTLCLRTEGIRKENYQAIVEFALKAQKLEAFRKNPCKDQFKVKTKSAQQQQNYNEGVSMMTIAMHTYFKVNCMCNTANLESRTSEYRTNTTTFFFFFLSAFVI